MFNIAICDGCPIQAELIRMLLDKYQTGRPGIKFQTHIFNSGEKLLNSIKSGKSFDLLTLEIILSGLDGIEAAKEVHKYNEDAVLIFMTSSEKYALEAFSVSAFQYILKPVGESKLFPVLDKAFVLLSQKKERFFLLYAPGRTFRIAFSSIVCIEHEKRKLRLYLDNGDSISSKFLRQPFASAIIPLLRDARFLYAHKSFVVNMEKVKELTDHAFIMENGVNAPIPRYRYTEVKAKFQAYFPAL